MAEYKEQLVHVDLFSWELVLYKNYKDFSPAKMISY